jgi:hypothetical protein
MCMIGARAEIWSPECAKSRLNKLTSICNLNFSRGIAYNTPDSLEWGREGKEGVGQGSEREEKIEG